MRLLINCVIFLAAFQLSSSIALSADKKLIEFGWDEPDTAFLRAHITQMEQTPFDGCVFHVTPKLADGQQLNFTWTAWGHRAFSQAELQPALEDLKATRIGRFKHNFLRFNVTPGDVDWFEDFSAITNNARLAAHLAKEGQCAGILFDVEPYEKPLFDFRKQQNAEGKWEAYTTQVRQRGRELMSAFQSGYPGLKVFLTFGHSIAWAQMDNGKKPLQDCQYGLLPALLDGMLDAARGKTRIVDGCELAYSYKEPNQFERKYETMKKGLLPIVADSKKYAATMSFGFGLWMDYDSHKRPWETSDVSKNYFTPEQFEASVREALKVADEYVWVYTEKPRWWTDAGGPTNLPSAYVDAVRGARERVRAH